MSSGEVLFILAFIVLPTAILVSSVWAVVFVRRRPEPRARYETDEASVQQAEQDPAGQPTAVLPTIETPANEPMAANDEPQLEEPAAETEVEVIHAAEESVPAAEQEFDEPFDPEPEEPQPVAAPLETQVPQTTEDLDEVVTALNSVDDAEEPEQPALQEPEPELEPEPEPVAEVETAEDEERFETSELPVVEQQPVPSPAEVEEVEETRTGRQRRRQSVKLLPGDSEAPRQRGRNRDAQRQVPQLNRSFRRKDEPQPGPPSDPHGDDDSPNARG